MIGKPATPEAYRLMHDGILALSRVEATGIGVDVAYVKSKVAELKEDMRRDTEALKESEEYRLLRKRFGAKAKITSDQQMSVLFYQILGYIPSSYTEKGAPAVDEQALQEIGTPFSKAYLRLKKKRKLTGTFLAGILEETNQESQRLHASFNLHIPRTFRGSSDSPNFQNFPVRDPYMAQVIRSAFRAKKDYRILEIDYSGIEVRGAACYHKDPVMLRYIKDQTKDMHRDMAQQCFMIDSPDQVSKQVRYCGKNMFVFPQFYGDFYMNNARALWDAMEKMSLEVAGVPMRDHLRSKGITKRGDCVPGNHGQEASDDTFESHIREVENDFWNNRFKRYGQWKRKWLDQYQRDGGFTMLTGFRIEGVLSKNDVINWPVQGASFHCLLWSLISIAATLRKRRMRTRIIGQIHDSIIAEVYKGEEADYVQIAHEAMTRKVREHWDWIITPLEIEVEAAPLGGTWYEKTKIDYGKLLTGEISI